MAFLRIRVHVSTLTEVGFLKIEWLVLTRKRKREREREREREKERKDGEWRARVECEK